MSITAEALAVSSRPTLRDWLIGLVVGAVAGALFLGIGGRVAMRVVGILQEWTLSFSVSGSVTVVWMGTLAGIAGAVAYLTLRSVPRLPRLVGGALFWTFVAFMSLRILEPIDRERLVAFFPVIIGYGLVQQLGSTRLLRRRRPC